MSLQVVGLFCEDIREEKSGQFTLIGILPDNVNIPAPPDNPPDAKGIIPKLGLYVRIRISDFNASYRPLSLKLVFPDSTELNLGTINPEVIESAKKQAAATKLPIAGIIHHAVIEGFGVPHSGQVLAVLDGDEERHICAVLNFVVPKRDS